MGVKGRGHRHQHVIDPEGPRRGSSYCQRRPVLGLAAGAELTENTCVWIVTRPISETPPKRLDDAVTPDEDAHSRSSSTPLAKSACSAPDVLAIADLKH